MILKTLSLAGFKSFADRTRLEFESGVNVVVGPNGSGKSNILDALAWVMGTQATRMLRTARMEDVIFAGTATRPQLGRAEVSLTFDNTDGFIGLDLSEVTLTRRLFRDGTSEYAVNGASCRLLDIQELLSDAGIGRQQHVLVSQGQIGEILNARPDEHRAVIEEAAGVTKHRSRRDRSVRRLEQTEQDVLRLNDILAEQQRRLRPLKRQANAAARYHDVKAEARALRLWLGGEELRRIRGRLKTAGDEHARLDQVLKEATAEMQTVSADVTRLQAETGETGKALERDTLAAGRLETSGERLHRIALVARERRSSLEGQMRGADERRADLEIEVEDLAKQIIEGQEAAETARAAAERREASLMALEDEERSLAEQIQLPAEGLVATLRGDLRALETADQRDVRERESTDQRRQVVEARLTEERIEEANLGREIQKLDAELTGLQEQYSSSRTRRETVQESLENAENALQSARLAFAEASARATAIESALDGLGDPEALALAESHEEVLGSVVQRLDVPDHVARAVDAALGSWADALVTGDLGAVSTVAASVKSLGAGGVSLVARDGDPADAIAKRVASEWGLDALIDLLGPAADQELAATLFADVVVVEGWSSAFALVERVPEVVAVTPEGDVITRRGMRLAEPDGAGRAVLEASLAAAEASSLELKRAESHHLGVRREFDTSRSVEREALEKLESVEARLAGATEALALRTRSRVAGESELARLEERTEALAEAIAHRAGRIGELRMRVDEFEGEEAARQAAWDGLNERRTEVARRRDEARVQRQEAAAELAGALERIRLAEHRHAVALTELKGVGAQPVDPETIAHLGRVEQAARRAHELVKAHIAALRERQRVLRGEAGEVGQRLDVASRRREQLFTEISEAKDRQGALAIELAELRVRDEATAEALRRDADAAEEEALAAPRPELGEDVDAKERYESLVADIRRMGPINPLAAAEYEELAAQVELLDTQLADLNESRQSLKQVIQALDDEMATLFRDAFDEIDGFYQENFALVFPGGRGRLRLTDPNSPLSTGVEIDAQPQGKKVGRLSLLSGGERSLAALAFLFAVFRARPSPFYVLDEVEAALDDSNLRRFLRLVDTLRGAAQLVIITHQQQTMESADILYGVTMEPGESSKVLSKRIGTRQLAAN